MLKQKSKGSNQLIRHLDISIPNCYF